MFNDHDRILVLGAGGWFGQTFMDLVPPEILLLPIASSKRGPYETWNLKLLHDFNPTIVVNFAFVTSDHIAAYGLDNFVNVNRMLTQRLLYAAALPRVRSVMTVSSGAAKCEPLSMQTNAYGVLKLREEEALLALASPKRNVVIARAWSLSGPYVRNPHRYAFSDFVLQAWTGFVHIHAAQPVIRRYTSARDFLSVCTAFLASGWTGEIDSGGESIELGMLAEQIVAIVNQQATIERSSWTSQEASVYESDNSSWSAACEDLGFRPSDLTEQIRQTALGLLPNFIRRL